MTPEQKAALVSARVAGMLVKAAGMTASNDVYKLQGSFPLYDLADFERLLEEFGCGENDVLALFQGR